MKKIIDFFVWLFSSKYGDYVLHSTKEVQVAETEEVPDPNEKYGHVDPIDYITVKTGRYYTIKRQTWVAYHKKTGLPKYKTIDLPA